MTSIGRFPLLLLLSGAAILEASLASAQIPDTYKNLQVLPKDISKTEIVRTMRQWATELGVRCHHCHVGPEDLQGMDFATDEKPTKRAAREMIRMVQAINAGPLKALPPRAEPRQTVGCGNCHRGAPRPPLPLDEELVRAAEARGAAAADERWRELRRDHLGDGQYDFRPLRVGIAAVRLAEAGRFDEALSVARLNLEHYPGTAQVHVLIGEVLLRKGEPAAAAEAFRKALEIEPRHSGARRGLQQAEAATRSPR
jgi:tetratricopeptide (TPR) repeat protein